jgi:hypothetical protein
VCGWASTWQELGLLKCPRFATAVLFRALGLRGALGRLRHFFFLARIIRMNVNMSVDMEGYRICEQWGGDWLGVCDRRTGNS